YWLLVSVVFAFEDERKLLEKLSNSTYERRLRPMTQFNRDPVLVSVNIYIVNVGPVSEVDMTFKLGLVLPTDLARSKTGIRWEEGNSTLSRSNRLPVAARLFFSRLKSYLMCIKSLKRMSSSEFIRMEPFS
ncbi:uncharacterized protein LOC142356652, partial [Convolutriloba macropyga]|uniref:uncharacterized protein LOC142356652 n=1 Tax=Convolutriloba macropyga TaxID=536237 RepID=UPI003F521887